VRRLWGGISVYVCKTDAAGLELRPQEIYEAWRREGITLDLCRRYGLSEQRVRQIVAVKRRERRQKALEPVLPLGGSPPPDLPLEPAS
jgi:Mor family transcriptional regulator